MIRRWTASLAALSLLAGCSASADTAVVLSASSFAAPLESVATTFDLDLEVSPAGSQVVAAQLRGGAQADLVVLADPELALDLARELDLDDPLPIATSTLVVVARPGLADPGEAEQALADPNLDVVLADDVVPLGAATRQALDLLGIEVATERIVSLEDAATGVLAKLAAGAADLAVVYGVNARAAADRGDVVLLGQLAPDRIRVELVAIAVTERGRDLREFLRSEAVRDRLLELGLEAPERSAVG